MQSARRCIHGTCSVLETLSYLDTRKLAAVLSTVATAAAAAAHAAATTTAATTVPLRTCAHTP